MELEQSNLMRKTPEPELTTKQALKHVILLALPNIFIFALSNMNDMSSLIAISRTGNEQYISAVGTGNTIINMFCLQPLYSISIALDTLVSQSFGKEKYRICGVYLQQSFVLLILGCIPSFICLSFTEQILAMIGYDTVIAEIAYGYTSNMYLYIVLSVVFYFLNRFLNAQKIAFPQMAIIGITSVLHPLWCYLFVFYFNMDYTGLNYAYTITAVLNLILIVLYMYYSGRCERTMVPLSSEIFKDWGRFMKIASASIIMTMLEWCGYYSLMLLAGHFDDIALATNQIVVNADILFYMISVGVGSSLTTLVGNSLGRRKIKQAKLYALTSVLFNTALVYGLVALLLIFRHEVPRLYTPNEEVQSLYSKSIFVASVSFFIDCFQGILCRVFIAQGKQLHATYVNLFIYYLFMLPFGYILVVQCQLSLFGLWFSGICGYGTISIIFLTILYFQDWEKISEGLHKYGEVEDLNLTELVQR